MHVRKWKRGLQLEIHECSVYMQFKSTKGKPWSTSEEKYLYREVKFWLAWYTPFWTTQNMSCEHRSHFEYWYLSGNLTCVSHMGSLRILSLVNYLHIQLSIRIYIYIYSPYWMHIFWLQEEPSWSDQCNQLLGSQNLLSHQWPSTFLFLIVSSPKIREFSQMLDLKKGHFRKVRFSRQFPGITTWGQMGTSSMPSFSFMGSDLFDLYRVPGIGEVIISSRFKHGGQTN